tara:strand:+ start:798 stop:1088 length:291 start_codon:yes stop_codon:yes gene_type:complete
MTNKIVVSDVGTEVVELTAEEEAERNASKVAWDNAAPVRAMAALREERNRLLTETDWWAMPDSPNMTEAQKKYRSDLRDLPSTVDINNIVWPTKPE